MKGLEVLLICEQQKNPTLQGSGDPWRVGKLKLKERGLLIMALRRTLLEAGNMYHVWTHANGRENLFRTPGNYYYFLEKYALQVHPVAETFAYCLMPNHLHLMVRVRMEEELEEFRKVKMKNRKTNVKSDFGGLSKLVSQQFSNLFNGYTQAFNHQFDRKGSLFTPNFNRKQVDSDSYYARLIIYIHFNPVLHGFVKKPDDWPYSSWHTYSLNKSTNLNREEGMTWFGSRSLFYEMHFETDFKGFQLLFER